MPLAKCPDCGYQVSQNASRCPKCGNDYFLTHVSSTVPDFCSACDGSGIASLTTGCSVCQGTGIQYKTNSNLVDGRYLHNGKLPFIDEQALLAKIKSQMPARKAKRINDLQKQIEEHKKIERGAMLAAIGYFIAIPLIAMILGVVIYGVISFFMNVFNGQRIDNAFADIVWFNGFKWGLLVGITGDAIMGLIYLKNRNKYFVK